MRATWGLLGGAAVLGAAAPAWSQAGGRPILETRLRYEGVDQGGFAQSAAAVTLRTRLGWETSEWNGLKALVEVEDVRAVGDYNDSVPPSEPYPVIGDPEITELNRAQLSWTPDPRFTGTLGRQRIALDDQRFVGPSAWRQDEQTFDAARVDLKLGGATATVAWLGRVNRVFGDELDWDSDSWIVNAGHKGTEWLKPTAFVYALDLEDAPASSSVTVGVRVTGQRKLGAVTLGYAASLAEQSDHGNAPTRFDLGYRAVEVTGGYKLASVRASYEALEGDGRRGFSTPLATLHAFQGWADVFLTTPADGLEDRNLGLTLRPRKLELTVRRHDFEAERTGRSLGEEIDFLVAAPIGKRVTALAKYADYDGVPGFPSRRKLWLSLEFKY